MATDVTRAYSVVENPLLRALHLLDLWGSPIGEEDHVSFYSMGYRLLSLDYVNHLLTENVYSQKIS